MSDIFQSNAEAFLKNPIVVKLLQFLYGFQKHIGIFEIFSGMAILH